MSTPAFGPKAKCRDVRYSAAVGVKADSARTSKIGAIGPSQTSAVSRGGPETLSGVYRAGSIIGYRE